MKKFLYLIAFAGCAAMLFTFCKNNAPKTEGTDPDTEAAIKAAADAKKAAAEAAAAAEAEEEAPVEAPAEEEAPATEE